MKQQVPNIILSFYAQSSSWRANSHITMPAVVLTLRLCLVPNCGISKQPSHRSTTLCCTPFTSFPNTTAQPLAGVSACKFNFCSLQLPSTCSTAQTKQPLRCSVSTAVSADEKYCHATLSSPPKAVLWISVWGGVAVMPQRQSASMRKASPERNTLPTLYRLRTLSNTTTRGSFCAALNASIERRVISIVLSFLMLLAHRSARRP